MEVLREEKRNIFSLAWEQTLARFRGMRAIEIVDCARRIGSGLSATSLSRFKNGTLDLSGESLHYFLLALKICKPEAFAFYMDKLEDLVDEKTVDGSITVSINSNNGIPRDQQIQIIFALCNFMVKDEFSVNVISQEVGIEVNRLSLLIQGCELKEEEFYKIKYFLGDRALAKK